MKIKLGIWTAQVILTDGSKGSVKWWFKFLINVNNVINVKCAIIFIYADMLKYVILLRFKENEGYN